jgi:hypothetical protein
LHYCSIAGKYVRIDFDTLLRGNPWANRDYSTPFCKSCTKILILNKATCKTIQTLRVKCPPIVYTDLNGLFCKVLEEAHLSS